MRLSVCLVLLTFELVGPASAQETQTAIPVGTVIAARQPITRTSDFVGRVEAVNRVEVRARVKGYLDAVLFKEGDVVNEGSPLYQIEKGLFEADVQKAEGALERSKAAKILSAIQLQRAEELLAKASGTVVARDQALAADEQAKGAILSDEGNLATAKINLGYTDITAPITGKIGRTNITKGNVVGPESGSLTLIVSQDPMYVTFPVSQRELLRAQQAGRTPDAGRINVRIRFSDRTMYDQVGEMNFLDVTVERTTDTVIARATIPNPKGTLIDGQLVSVVLEAAKPEEKIVIPQSTLIADQQGTYVFIVDDGKVAIRRIKPGGTSGTGVVIEEGLTGGEQVIVEGIQRVRPGQPVQASPVPAALRGS